MFGDIVIYPNKYFIMPSPDGSQIYFNFFYHIKYGNGAILTNQNYPYYESIFMTDAQSSWSILFSYINHHIYKIENYSMGIFNAILLYSIPLCSFFLYKIFRHLGISNWHGVIFAILICFLSPQLLRITCGHYGLGYLFYFPALIYFLLKLIDESSHPTQYFLYTLGLLIFFGINNGHMSLAGFMQVFVFGLIWLIANFKKKGIRKYLPILSACISLFIVFIIFYSFEIAHDRETSPWGFLIFHAQFESIFLPTSGIIHDFINKLTPITNVNIEGEAYVGIIGIFILAFCAYRLIRFIIQKKVKRILFPLLNKQVNILILASLPILMYSMAYPFRWGLEFLLEAVPFLKQFRCPGRFAWIFYYSFSIYITYYLFIVFRYLSTQSKFFAYTLILLVVCLYTMDIYSLSKFNFRYLNGKNYSLNTYLDHKTIDSFLTKHHIDSSTYQAIYGLPICNAWSAKFSRGDDPSELVKQMMQISYSSGLPWINAKLSRISVSQIMKSAQLVSHPLIEKELLSVLPSNKNILIIHKKDSILKTSEKYFLSNCLYIGSDDRFDYYSFNPLNRNLYKYRDSIKTNFSYLAKQNHALQTSLKKEKFIIQNYMTTIDKLVSDDKDDQIIFSGVFSQADSNLKMDFSIWNQVDHKTDGAPWIEFLIKDSSGKICQDSWHWAAKISDYQHGYVRIDIPFEIHHPTDSIIIKLKPGHHHQFERMLIKPSEVDVYDSIANRYLLNNYWLD